MVPPALLLLLGLTGVAAFDSSEIRMLDGNFASSKRSEGLGRFERSLEDGMTGPLIRFGKRSSVAEGAPLIRFGRAPEASPLIRFGKRNPDGAPLISLGKQNCTCSTNMDKFGRAPEASPLIRFGKRTPDGAPLIRFGRSDGAPLIRFGRSPASDYEDLSRDTRAAPLIRFGRK